MVWTCHFYDIGKGHKDVKCWVEFLSPARQVFISKGYNTGCFRNIKISSAYAQSKQKLDFLSQKNVLKPIQTTSLKVGNKSEISANLWTINQTTLQSNFTNMIDETKITK